ncbi:MAG: hypothetical protein ABWX83_12355 [Luteibacter sp.]
MTNSSEASLRREVGRDERMLWSGRPVQGLRLQVTDLYFMPVSLLWTGCIVYWEQNARHVRDTIVRAQQDLRPVRAA